MGLRPAAGLACPDYRAVCDHVQLQTSQAPLRALCAITSGCELARTDESAVHDRALPQPAQALMKALSVIMSGGRPHTH